MDDKPFTPISSLATQETAEPLDTSAAATTTTPAPMKNSEQTAATKPSKPLRDSSISSIPPPAQKRQAKHAGQITSAASSPIPSRESSPVRPSLKNSISTRSAPGPGRSRKNSSQDVSPARSSSSCANPPSAAATQRALSVASTPVLLPSASEPTIRAPAPQKPSAGAEVRETPRWPISPRLRSPPPIGKTSIISPRKIDQEPPSINVQRTATAAATTTTTPPVESQEVKQGTGMGTAETEAEDLLSIPGMRTPARGVSGASSTLETVQEISQPSTPSLEVDSVLEMADTSKSITEQDTSTDNASTKMIKTKPAITSNESGSESGGKGEIKMRSTSTAPPLATTRPSGPATKPFSGVGRGKPSGEGSTRNMTVETETVSSIPQVAVGGPAGAGNNGSIRTKPSSETIRPKKEKKKAARKAPSVTSGTASSKADIFEAKVASAVDEANSSDSEETFVYESNPPDNSDRPRRFHSRTPSATSMASQVDQRNGVRAIMDGHHSVAMKKSMKFANSYNSSGQQEATPGEDDGKGTARSNMGTGRGTTHHHHLGGRWGRNGGGNGHPSLFDNESPFPNAAKSKSGSNTPRHTSRPTSPKVANMRMIGNGKRSPHLSSSYDLDDGADDERTPLVSTVRSGRSARGRRQQAGSLRQLEHQASRHNRSFLARFAGCLVLAVMVSLVFSGAIGFMFATTQPLVDVKILALKNIIASEQDVIFDMKVQARNPNLVVVTIDSTDLVIFAKSSYAGTDTEWWRHPSGADGFLQRGLGKRDDDPLDPPLGDDPDTRTNLEIGRVYEFYSPLTFEGSPFHGEPAVSSGQIRITSPGNDTTPSGSQRWGKVVQHEFDLIVQGTLKYTLPLSQKLRSISVKGRVTVKPNAADQDPEEVHIM